MGERKEQGGGSALDAAKAIAARLANDGALLDYVEIIGRGKALTLQSAFLAHLTPISKMHGCRSMGTAAGY